MGRRSFSRGAGYLFLSLLILGLAFGTTLASEPGTEDPTLQAADRATQPGGWMERIRAAAAVHQRYWERLMEIPDVLGSGVGLGSDGEPIIKVFTARHGAPRIPEMLEGVPVHTEVSGRFYALRGETCDATSQSSDGQCTAAERWPLPVPTGVSVGHPAITAGTIAARVTKDNKVYLLSNNHVLANVNQASLGDPILQPGTYDGGSAADAIATLADYQQIAFCEVFWIWLMCDTTNTIDAAIALSDSGKLGFSTPEGQWGSIPGYGAPSRNIHPAYGDPEIIGDPNEDLSLLLGAGVKKYGRTTGLTAGTIDTINAAVNVCYDAECVDVARFTDQLIVTPGAFSAGGDSGSLVVSNDSVNHPVGLLFAGSDTITIINRIDFVLSRFGVTVDGGDVVGPSIDVAVTGIDVPTSVEEDQPVTVTVTVMNRGTVATGGFNVTLRDTGVAVGMQSVQGLAPDASAPVIFSWTPASPGLHTLEASHQLAGDENPGNDIYQKDVNVLLPPGGPQLQVRRVQAYTDRWTTVNLDYEYGDEMVVVCSPNYDLLVPGPAIARVKNARGSSFEVGLGRPWYGTFGGEDFSAMVHCMVVREGVYTVARDGVKMEAVRIQNFTATDHVGSWSGQRQVYQKSYTRPVVVGQVVSPDTGTPPSNCPNLLCDLDWSAFWSRGTAVTNPPSSGALYVGRHTGEDPNGRTAETLAYVVIEKGSGTIENIKYIASLGADTVRGMQNAPPYIYSISGLASASTAIVSQAGMDAADGGWPVLYGPNAVRPSQLRLAIDEDWYLYSERKHTTEQVFYIVFE
jgi:hypothetical protein